MWKAISAWLDQHPVLHGLLVVIESSVAGTVVDYIISGAQLDLSRDGLKKLGALILGSVVVALRNWLKTSPLRQLSDPNAPVFPPQRQSGFVRHAVLLLIVLLSGVLLLGAWSCSSWERTTFQTLSASKATVDCGVAAYNHDADMVRTYCAEPGVTISQTSANRALLDKARQTHDAAVVAFRDYWCLRYPSRPVDPSLGVGACASLPAGEQLPKDQVAAARQKAVIAVNALPELMAQIRTLLK